MPGLHAVGAIARDKHELPDGQSAQAVSPLPGWYLPDSHAAQMRAPSLGVIVPGSHAVAAVAPVAHAEPGGQVLQSFCAVAPAELR